MRIVYRGHRCNMFKQFFTSFFYIISLFGTVLCTFNVHLTHNGPIVKGATITFNATVYYGNDIAVNEKLEYDWKDNGMPPHTKFVKSSLGIDIWSVSYNSSIYPPGTYEVQVEVSRCYPFNIYCYPIGSVREYFDITDTLNGKFELQQNNVTRSEHFVSSKGAVTHIIDLKKTDADYIKAATKILSYWFVDCHYYGFNNGLTFDFNYTDPDKTHVIEALVMADFTPLPPTTTIPPSTTTTKTTTTTATTTTTQPTTTTKATTTKPTTKTTTITTTKPTTVTTTGSTTSKPNITTEKPNIISTKTLVKREVTTSLVAPNNNNTSKVLVEVNGTWVPYNGTFPYVCNSTQISVDPSKIYGYFSDVIEVKAPLSKPNVTGNNWLQPGDVLSLKVTCTGSKDLQYCIEYKKGEYNITGNETCFIYSPLDSCDFSITRYLSYPKYTIIIIIKNEVSKVVTPVTVNIYKVNKQGQLSVIVVPVAFSLVAVVMIVFGVAYYIQNRSRFVVEVADFNFGQQYSEVEYKTFRERLRDSVMNAFTRGVTPSNSEVPVWPPGQKYGSMT